MAITLTRDIVAIRFQYQKRSQTPWNFETIPFYIHYLRSFLQAHPGQAVWVKGAQVRREAILVFYAHLAERVKELMGKPLADLGSYRISWLNTDQIAEVIQETIALNRPTVGYLELPGQLKLGNHLPEEKPYPLPNPLHYGSYVIHHQGAWLRPDGTVRLASATWTHPNNPGFKDGPRDSYLQARALIPCRTCRQVPTERCPHCWDHYCQEHYQHGAQHPSGLPTREAQARVFRELLEQGKTLSQIAEETGYEPHEIREALQPEKEEVVAA